MLLFEFQFCSGNTEKVLCWFSFYLILLVYIPAGGAAGGGATSGDRQQVQAGSDRRRPRTSVGSVGAVSEPSVGHVAEKTNKQY